MPTDLPSQHTTPADLLELRAAIDQCDGEIVALLRHRLELSAQVAADKAGAGLPVRDPEREAAVVARYRGLAGPECAAAAESLATTLMRTSRERQYDFLMERGVEAFRVAAGFPPRAEGSLAGVRRAAFAGNAGSWSATATHRLFPDAEALSAPSFAAACDLVADGRADSAVLPLANTTGGPVDTVYRLLRRNLHIVRSLDLPVQHCLAGIPGATPDGIRTVASHPQALAQCSRAIREHGWATEESGNTAFAAADAARRADPSFAAICSPEAARANGLEVLLGNVCDTDVNATRFVAVSRDLVVPPDASRLGLLLRLPNRPGSLASVLDLFVDRSLNLSSICSQPVPERPWEYAFFLDVDAPALDSSAIAVVYQLERELPFLRVLGWYGE